MQDIRFRAWNKEDKTYNNSLQLIKDLNGDIGTFKLDTGTGKSYQESQSVCSIEQYSELNDINNNRIYEKDIVEVTPPDDWDVFDVYNSSSLGIFVVVKDRGAFLLFDKENYKRYLNNDNDYEYGYLGWSVCNAKVRVIGNIHKNPELLK